MTHKDIFLKEFSKYKKIRHKDFVADNNSFELYNAYNRLLCFGFGFLVLLYRSLCRQLFYIFLPVHILRQQINQKIFRLFGNCYLPYNWIRTDIAFASKL